ncbi:uncharacterized protein LOC125482337, partial [Rhincodon typus]|uniref:uncharacterized protein LOC125482337 n=1 Tax=Rhincodon typus TaxID=259920 RepID=UPI00202F3EBC
DPSLKPRDRLLSTTNRRTFPPPYCPIKRKRPAEACGNGQSVETCGAKVRGEDPVSSTGPIGADSIRGAGTSIKCDHSPGTLDPVPDQPLALIKKRPFSNRPTSDHSRLRPPTLLQQEQRGTFPVTPWWTSISVGAWAGTSEPILSPPAPSPSLALSMNILPKLWARRGIGCRVWVTLKKRPASKRGLWHRSHPAFRRRAHVYVCGPASSK